MNEDSVVYVGVDAAKAKHAVAIAESGRSGEVRYVGEIETTPAAVERFVRRLARKHQLTVGRRRNDPACPDRSVSYGLRPAGSAVFYASIRPTSGPGSIYLLVLAVVARLF